MSLKLKLPSAQNTEAYFGVACSEPPQFTPLKLHISKAGLIDHSIISLEKSSVHLQLCLKSGGSDASGLPKLSVWCKQSGI